MIPDSDSFSNSDRYVGAKRNIDAATKLVEDIRPRLSKNRYNLISEAYDALRHAYFLVVQLEKYDDANP